MIKFFKPIDIASSVFFRVAFGLTAMLGSLRYLVKGWVTELYVKPTFFFSYEGFDWIHAWPAPVMYGLYITLAVLGLLIALGCFYRVSIVLYFLAFTYVELIDKTAYLNHYYAISLISFLMIFLPLHRALSVDAWRKPSLQRQVLPAWCVWIVRFQLGCVYFFAGIAKLNWDWLFRGEPLDIWLAANRHLPILGTLFSLPHAGQVMSVLGALFDLTIVLWLLFRPTRLWAYATVVVFHVITGLCFNIGMFPIIMIGLTPIFFDPSWPRLWSSSWMAPLVDNTEFANRKFLTTAALAIYVAVQIALPLRHFLYPGNVSWTEEGFRFSWRVMLVEKNGYVRFIIKDPTRGKVYQASLEDYLTNRQQKLASASPDMLLQMALHIADDFKQRGIQNPEVYAEAWASMNERAEQRLIDPTMDLAKEKRGLKHYSWILPLQPEATAMR
jgi:vitamin K-dependent gamma-carboxylase